jgi:hypothetical protein
MVGYTLPFATQTTVWHNDITALFNDDDDDEDDDDDDDDDDNNNNNNRLYSVLYSLS